MPKLKSDEIQKLVDIYNNKCVRESQHITAEDFIEHARRYIKASKQTRLMAVVKSRTGSYTTFRVVELTKYPGTNNHGIYLFNTLLKSLGFTGARDTDFFRINGGFIDMIRQAHYLVIYRLHRLGFTTKKAYETLEQNTPHSL